MTYQQTIIASAIGARQQRRMGPSGSNIDAVMITAAFDAIINHSSGRWCCSSRPLPRGRPESGAICRQTAEGRVDDAVQWQLLAARWTKMLGPPN